MKLTQWFPGDVKPVHIGVYERLTIERDEARRTAREAHEAGTRVVAQRDALLEALRDIAGTDPVDAALDPQRAVRIARAAIKAAEGESHAKVFEAPPGFVLNPDYLVPELSAQRDALLEALRTLLSYAFTLEMRLLDADGEHRAMQKARAAIAKAEGEKA